MTVPRMPPHAVGELATFELDRYRADLETALVGIAKGTADHVLIERRLAQVEAEQAMRARRFMGTWTDSL